MTTACLPKQLGIALLLAVLASGIADSLFAQQENAPDSAEATDAVLIVSKNFRMPQCTAKRQVYSSFDITSCRNTPNLNTYIHPERFNGPKFLEEHDSRLRHLLKANRAR